MKSYKKLFFLAFLALTSMVTYAMDTDNKKSSYIYKLVAALKTASQQPKNNQAFDKNASTSNLPIVTPNQEKKSKFHWSPTIV